MLEPKKDENTQCFYQDDDSGKSFIGLICPIKTDLVTFKKLWLQHFDYSAIKSVIPKHQHHTQHI